MNNDKLNVENWKYFNLVGKDGLFDYDHGTRITSSDSEEGDIPLITAGENNSGINRFISKPEKNILYKNCITIDMFGNSFYHNYEFVCDDNIYPIYPKNSGKQFNNNYIAIFISCIINFSRTQINSYGYQFREKILTKMKIKLPSKNVNGKDEPDWRYMEEYIKNKYKSNLELLMTNNTINKNNDLLISKWHEFKLSQIFDKFEKGKCSNAPDLEPGNDIPYIGAKKNDNGVMQMVAHNKSLESQGNCVAFICQGAGSNGFNLYIDRTTIQTTSNTLGYSKKLNKYNGLFLVAVLDMERPKWCFGRGRAPKLKDTIIKLPADKKGQPDWEYMENYIKNLPYGDKI